jgi:hypothetical protein
MSLLPSTRIVRAFASVPVEALRLIVDRETRTADDRLAVPLPSIERSRPRRGSPFEPAVDPIIGAPAWPAWRRANCVRPSDQRPVERVAEYYHDMPCPEPSRERWLALGASVRRQVESLPNPFETWVRTQRSESGLAVERNE